VISDCTITMTVTDGWASVQVTNADGVITHEVNDYTVAEAADYVTRVTEDLNR